MAPRFVSRKKLVRARHDDTDGHSNKSLLATLPEETVCNIAVKLGSDDLFALRLTCRAIEAKIFHEFATEYFNTKGFIFTTKSLKTLARIAGSNRLRGYLRTLYFFPVFFTIHDFSFATAGSSAWQPTVRQSEALATYIDDQALLEKSGQDRKLLVSAFRKLTAVENLHFVTGVDPVHLNVDICDMFRAVRTTGRISHLVSSATETAEEHGIWEIHVWRTLMHAIARSGISTITTLSAINKTPTNFLSVNHELNLSRKTLFGLGQAFRGLKRLDISIDASQRIGYDGVIDDAASIKVMRKFAAVLHAPEELQLSFDFTPLSGRLFFNMLKDLQLSKITKLEVECMSVGVGSLIAILKNLTSIKFLHLHQIDLTKGPWVPVLKALQELTGLEHLHLMWLLEASRHVYFLTQPEAGAQQDLHHPIAAEIPVGDWLHDHESPYGSDDHHDGENVEDFMLCTLFDSNVVESSAHTSEVPHTSEADTIPLDGESVEEAHCAPDFKAPGYDGASERGYYVCIHGSQIADYLVRFIKEYNVRAEPDDINAAFHFESTGSESFANTPAVHMPAPMDVPENIGPVHVVQSSSVILNNGQAPLHPGMAAGANAQSTDPAVPFAPPHAVQDLGEMSNSGPTVAGGSAGGQHGWPFVEHGSAGGAVYVGQNGAGDPVYQVLTSNVVTITVTEEVFTSSAAEQS